MRGAVNDWEHALVTGNGRQGALCWGTPEALRLTVSHERLFLPLGAPLDPPDTARILPGAAGAARRGPLRRGGRRGLRHGGGRGARGTPRRSGSIRWSGRRPLTLRPRRPGPARDFRRERRPAAPAWSPSAGGTTAARSGWRSSCPGRPTRSWCGFRRLRAEMALIDGTPPGPIKPLWGLDLEVRVRRGDLAGRPDRLPGALPVRSAATPWSSAPCCPATPIPR